MTQTQIQNQKCAKEFMICLRLEIFTLCQKTMEVMPVIMLQERYKNFQMNELQFRAH